MDPFTIASLVVAAVGIGVSVRQQQLAEEQADIQAAASKEQEGVSRRQAIRERRIQQARIEQASENIGAAGSSAEAAGITSIAAQTAEQERFAAAQTSLFSQSADVQRQAGQAQLIGAGARALGQVGGVLNTTQFQQPQQPVQQQTVQQAQQQGFMSGETNPQQVQFRPFNF